MILCIGNVLDDNMLGQVKDLAGRGHFLDGKKTAGWAAAGVKNNMQLAGDDKVYKKISSIVMDAIGANEVFAAAALPRSISRLLISRCDEGMGYGTHVDNAIMGTPPLRTDLAFTLFISDPSDYSGGELIIEDPQGEQDIKLGAGELVLYPATTKHRVNDVKKGSRLVAVGWVQSLVNDPRVREMLFDLYGVRQELFAAGGKSPAFDTLSKVHSNLLRLSAEI